MPSGIFPWRYGFIANTLPSEGRRGVLPWGRDVGSRLTCWGGGANSLSDRARKLHCLVVDLPLPLAQRVALSDRHFYEVGYAHALCNPTILLAEKGTRLPFDVSPFRTLFYENSIAGKRVFEEGLRRHVGASLQQKGAT